MTNEELAKKYFEFPLKMDNFGGIIWTNDDGWAFNILQEFDDEVKEKLIIKLNTGVGVLKTKFIVDGQEIKTVNGDSVLLIRSWGRLTGIGGFNLSSEQAIKIQDVMLQYCCEQLNK